MLIWVVQECDYNRHNSKYIWKLLDLWEIGELGTEKVEPVVSVMLISWNLAWNFEICHEKACINQEWLFWNH